MINFQRNNLDLSSSPYLQQHKNNPIHWQEWSKEVLAHATQQQKIIFVSIGYATCHWCHIMAQQAFSHQHIAAYLNKHFACIKVDREQRPDIDHYCMSFMQETQGHGGWPLNVFLTPDAKPIYATTYVPTTAQYGLPGFLDLLRHIKESYTLHSKNIPSYHLSSEQQLLSKETQLLATIKAAFTGRGFGSGPQFPPHNTLLFLLYDYEQHQDAHVKDIMEKILDAMAISGLHDHLQGGFFRYCVDESWTIPHFEKMLYDQAMLLWVYSLAYKILHKPTYKVVAEKIIACLEQTFAADLYYCGHDADTNHTEAGTYLWSKEELHTVLSEEEYQLFAQIYAIQENFEGKIHLLKNKNAALADIEKKLLRIRSLREQPAIDKKYLTSWNALLGIALLMHYRYTQNTLSKMKAELLFKGILKHHYKSGILHHSSYLDKVQPGEFLEDYAAMLLFATYLCEENGEKNREYKELMEQWLQRLDTFSAAGRLSMNRTDDFAAMPAPTYDHPTPSGISLAAFATLRAAIMKGQESTLLHYKPSLSYDFFNLAASVSNGKWHIIHTPHQIEWKHLPANAIQIIGPKVQDCYGGKCVEFDNVSELLSFMKRVQSQA